MDFILTLITVIINAIYSLNDILELLVINSVTFIWYASFIILSLIIVIILINPYEYRLIRLAKKRIINSDFVITETDQQLINKCSEYTITPIICNENTKVKLSHCDKYRLFRKSDLYCSICLKELCSHERRFIFDHVSLCYKCLYDNQLHYLIHKLFLIMTILKQYDCFKIILYYSKHTYFNHIYKFGFEGKFLNGNYHTPFYEKNINDYYNDLSKIPNLIFPKSISDHSEHKRWEWVIYGKNGNGSRGEIFRVVINVNLLGTFEVYKLIDGDDLHTMLQMGKKNKNNMEESLRYVEELINNKIY